MTLFITAFFVLVIDQISKQFVLKYLDYSQPIKIIENFFYLNHVHNPGAAFGIFPNSRTFFIIFALVTIIVLIFYCFKKTPAKNIHKIIFGLIIGGAIGNLIDRIRFGYVIDFLDFYFGKFHYPTFNIADSCICIGIGLVMLYLLRNQEELTQK